MEITSVRLHKETKTDLDRLRRLLVERRGKHVTMDDAVKRLIELAWVHEYEFVGQSVQRSKEEVDRWMEVMTRNVRDWGVDSDGSRIRSDLYGSPGRED